MSGESKLRITRIKRLQLAIPCYFCQNTGSANALFQRVPADNGLAGNKSLGAAVTVNQR